MTMKQKSSPKGNRMMGPKESRPALPKPNNYMKCTRCGGAMVFERFQATVEIFYAWRCVNCGDIMDQVVAKNRELLMTQKKQAVGE